MAFHIRNEATDRLARKVARLKRCGITEAVHTALERELLNANAEIPLADQVAIFSAALRAKSSPERGQPADKAFFDALSGDE